MSRNTHALVVVLVGLILLGSGLSVARADEALDGALAALKGYDWGSERSVLEPIDAAVAATHGNEAARKGLEKQLAAVLKTDAPQAAKDFVCRKLSLIGSADCVPALAPLLADEKLSHMARYALERMPCPEAVQAMRESLGKVSGRQKVGVVNSLGVRRDAASVSALVALLKDSDSQLAAAAAAALGSIGNADAAKALGEFQAEAPDDLQLAAADAYLSCAEKLLADGKKLEAMAAYKSLSKSEHKHVRLAAMRGLLAVAGKK